MAQSFCCDVAHENNACNGDYFTFAYASNFFIWSDFLSIQDGLCSTDLLIFFDCFFFGQQTKIYFLYIFGCELRIDYILGSPNSFDGDATHSFAESRILTSLSLRLIKPFFEVSEPVPTLERLKATLLSKWQS